MAYQSLYKLFYMDKEKYDKEYNLRFNAPGTIHLNINIGKFPAFVCDVPELYRQIVTIERTDKQINEACGKLPMIALEQFSKRCLIDEIILTNNIEGVVSTRKEINALLNDLSEKNRRKRFFGLVNKYRFLMKKKDTSLKKCEDIRKIYDDIFFDEIKSDDPDNLPDGDIFRKSEVSVLSVSGKEIHNGLSPESKIISAMNCALDFLNDDRTDFFIRTAVFHYLFGYIHPFYDGNGRTSRFISSLFLSENLNGLVSYCLSYTIKENISDYYEAFKICNHINNKGDITPFVEMFLGIIVKAEQMLLQRLTDGIYKMNRYFNYISTLSDNEEMKKLYFLLIQASLFSENGLTLDELEKNTGRSYNTLNSRLKIIPEKLIEKNKIQNKVFYMINLDEFDMLL